MQTCLKNARVMDGRVSADAKKALSSTLLAKWRALNSLSGFHLENQAFA